MTRTERKIKELRTKLMNLKDEYEFLAVRLRNTGNEEYENLYYALIESAEKLSEIDDEINDNL